MKRGFFVVITVPFEQTSVEKFGISGSAFCQSTEIFISQNLGVANKKGRVSSPASSQYKMSCYSWLPMNINKNWNMFRKSRYRFSAPWIADLSNHSWSP